MESPTARPASSAALPGVTADTTSAASKFRVATNPTSATLIARRDQMQSHVLEEIIPRNFVRAGNIFLEEPSQVGMADGLGGATHSVGVGKELSFPRVVLIHPMKDVANRGGVVSGLAHLQVEQYAQQVSLVVIRNAARGQAVVVVFFQPRIQAGFFHRLSEMGRTPLQFANLSGQALEIAAFIQQAGAQQDNVRRRGGRALAEPQRSRVVFFGVVDRLERLGPDSLHVPQVKEFVSGQAARMPGGCSPALPALRSMAVPLACSMPLPGAPGRK